MTHRYLSLLVILVALSTLAYSAEIVFSNLSPPDNSYNRSAGLVVGSPGLPIVPQIPAVAFTPDGDFTLTQIGVALLHITGTNSAMLSLDSSIGGLPDGTIESWTLTPLPPFGSNTILQTVTPDIPVSLVSGTQYWLVVSPIASDTNDVWNFSLTDTISPIAASHNGGSSFSLTPLSQRPAFDVLGNPVGNEVPEPSSLELLAIGIVGVIILGAIPPRTTSSESRDGKRYRLAYRPPRLFGYPLQKARSSRYCYLGYLPAQFSTYQSRCGDIAPHWRHAVISR